MPPRRRSPSCLLALLVVLLAGSASASPLVRVLLAVVPDAVIDAPGAHRATIDGAPAFATPVGLRWPVGVADGRLVVDGRPVGRRMLFEAGAELLAFEGRSYRGGLELVAAGDRIDVINVLELEDYLRGVVPSEMSASWPAEALKAQAVAARSYTLTSLHPEAEWDLCATDDCQVYRGAQVEDPRSDAAVRATEGVVVTYDGQPARTYYHSDSGGTVASAAEVWGTPSPYLVALRDPPSDGPHRSWTATVDPGVVAASLRTAGRDVGAVAALRVLAVTESGRVERLQVVGSAGDAVLEGPELTRLARAWGLRSTRFQVVAQLRVQGQGWGHGVGMSQYGARALARERYDYGAILAYYYPHTQLTRYVYTAARPATDR